jgi:hypothetical protein
MMTLATCLTALCAAAAAPQQKTPELVGVLAVSPPPGPGPDLVEVTGKLRDELAKRLDGVLSARELKDRMSGQSTASLSDLDRAYASAVDGAKRDPVLAISWLRDIISELERHPGGADVYEQWTRANLRLARMRLEYASSPEEGESGAREARQVVERALRLQLQLQLDSSLFPKRLIALVEEVRASLSKAPLHKLVVKSAVEGAKVYVDGKEAGPTPLTLQVPAGVYRVSGMQGGLRSPSVIADARETDTTVALDFALAATFRPAQGPGLATPDAEQESRILQSARALGLDRVVTASLVEQKTTYLVASVTPAKPGGAAPPRQGWIRLSTGGLPPEVVPQMAEYLATGQAKGDLATSAPAVDKSSLATTSTLEPQLRLAAPGLGSELEATRSGSPLLKWSPVVAAGAALALGAVALWEGSRSNGLYDGASQWKSASASLEVNSLIADGASARSASIGCGVGAGVALAATAVLGYLSYKQSHEIGPFRF